MPKMEWGAVGQRFFETGIDRGVLYPQLGMGVPWDGLISVTEKSIGGEPKPYYYDGFKYLNLSVDEEFEATISAYSAPRQFDKCDGSVGVLNGLTITQQRRENFGFAYRTRIGNDIDGATHGYKIHLVYNALAGPTERSNQSLNDSVSPMSLSWSITTAPPQLVGYRPSAHFVIDSRYTPVRLLEAIEAMLYGTDYSDPYLPDIGDLMELFSSQGPEIAENLVFGAPGTIQATRVDGVEFDNDTWYQFTSTATTGGMRRTISGLIDGLGYTASAEVANPGASAITLSRISLGDVNLYSVTLQPGERRIITFSDTRETYSGYNFFDIQGNNGIVFLVRLDTVVVEGTPTEILPFNGSTPDTDTHFYSWLGAENASKSVVNSWY